MNRSMNNIALALNNTGVALMQRCCFRKAALAFQDAATVTRDLFGADPHRHSGALTAHQVHTKLLQASRSLVECSSPKEISSSTPTSTEGLHHNIHIPQYCSSIHVSSLEPSYHFVARQLAENTFFTSTQTVLLRVEDTSLPAEVQAAIVLFNFGQAYRHLAYTESNPGLLTGARQLTELAYKVLSDSSQDDEEEDNDQSLLPLGLLIVRALLKLGCCKNDCGDEQDYEDECYFEVANNLQHILLEQNAIACGTVPSAAAA